MRNAFTIRYEPESVRHRLPRRKGDRYSVERWVELGLDGVGRDVVAGGERTRLATPFPQPPQVRGIDHEALEALRSAAAERLPI
jgi:uncharacterized membrane protein